MSLEQKTLLVMAGGTGGHIFPGLAVADELHAKGWKIHWLGTADKMEAQIIPAHGYDISFINISGVRHKRALAVVLMPFKLMMSVLQARRVLKSVKPDVVLGMGGYASAPGGIAAWLSNIPLVVHEQNAAAGLSNRLLSKFANKVCCAFPNAFVKEVDAEVVGNPLRATITQQVFGPCDEVESKNILVIGGSLGAQVLNEVMPDSFAKLHAEDNQFCIWHQTGKDKQSKVIEAYKTLGISNEKIKVTEFIKDMSDAYQWADVVICRAGALTVSEIAMAGKPAVFVPLPHAVDDHQTKNAKFLVEQGAAKLLVQQDLNQHSVSALLAELFSAPETLKNMAIAASNAATTDAREKVAAICQQLTQQTESAVNTDKEKI